MLEAPTRGAPDARQKVERDLGAKDRLWGLLKAEQVDSLLLQFIDGPRADLGGGHEGLCYCSLQWNHFRQRKKKTADHDGDGVGGNNHSGTRRNVPAVAETLLSPIEKRYSAFCTAYMAVEVNEY